MSIRHSLSALARPLAGALAAACCLLLAVEARAQFLNQQVGGISIDAQGMVSKVRVDELNQLKQHRQRAFQAVPADLQDKGLRKISLRAIEAAIAEHRKNNTPLSDDIRYLAGIQRIQYVFVFPEQQDIVIAGPAEGWKLNQDMEVVGATTNRPVLLLDDLLVALRSHEMARTGIFCSIDPTPEGLARSAKLTRQLVNPGANIDPVLDEMERAMGPQIISVKGVPDTSHFARVLVAADYRMKRIAMGFDESPVPRLQNFLQMVRTGGKRPRSMLPRWWLEPDYESIVADAEGLSYELRGGSVKTLTEDEVINAQGQKQASGKIDPIAKKWADSMTANYDELATKDAVFGQLRNCIDLAVLAALISKENLTEKAGWSMPLLLNPELQVTSFNAPKQVDSQASAVNKSGDWIISVSGGVKINVWQPLEKPTIKPELNAVRTKSAAPGTNWWWN